ncbi:MAG TPA: SMC-Scp complex subunit ScpB [Candidatus Nanopelagicaceae bacterium]|nr:SMC-Scp complex subunit ScpB [Candidatus Nanopelagicaceae bacterium]
MNEKNDKEPENHFEPKTNEDASLDEAYGEDIPQEEKSSEDIEIDLETKETIEEYIKEDFEEEEIKEDIKEEFNIEEEESLSIESSEERLSEQDTEFIGDDKDESQIPQELTKEELELQLKILRRNLIEGALYAAGRPLDVEELSTKLEIPKKEVEELVRVVAFDYLEHEGALIVAQIGEKYQMQLRPELTETVSKFAKGGAIAERYLRTLTVIALKQPILKSTVIKLRGSGAYEHVKYLLDNDLISAEKKGRSAELTTTDKYADMFGLPKNKEELKRMMVSQLGLGEDAN